MEINSEWALEHLATKSDIERLEVSIRLISEENADCNRQRTKHEEKIRQLESINTDEKENRWHITGYIIVLAAPVSALVAWIVSHIKSN